MIILYGGSFNPPTIAHFTIAKTLIEKYQPRAFIFIPVGNHYQKRHLVDFKHRYQMLQYLSEKLNHTSISTLENDTKEFKGTIHTLDYYQRLYPQEEIYYVIGADNLLTIHTWIHYEEMVKKYKFIVLNRDEIDLQNILDKIPFKNHFIIEESFKKMNVSASNYRESLNNQVVLEEINQYIYQHNLYNRGGKYEK